MSSPPSITITDVEMQTDTGNNTAISSFLQPSADIKTLEEEFSTALHEVRVAEVIHAYDVGIMVAMEAMRNEWLRRIALRHLSRAERQIFRREARRLTGLLDDARFRVRGNQEGLEAKFARRDRARERLAVARVEGRKYGKNESGGSRKGNEDIGHAELTDDSEAGQP